MEEIAKEVLVDLDTLNSMLEKRKKKAGKLGEFQTTLRDFGKTVHEKEFHRRDYLNDVRDFRFNSQIAKLGNQIPFDCHLQFLRSALYLGNSELFMSFLNTALKRSNLFHFEKPYISDIVLMESEEKIPMVDRDYSMIDIDLNQPHLVHQIEELRGKFWSANLDANADGRRLTAADKTPEAANLVKINSRLSVSKDELKSIGYKFLYILVKHSEQVEEAITHLEVEIATEKEGPPEKMRGEWTCRPIPISQYRGIKATYGTIPWLCFRADKTSSQYLSEISPLISFSKHVRPKFGYQKIETDLRQVPKEFIKLTNIQYSFLTCRFENSLSNNKLLLKIYQKFYLLEKSYSIGKSEPVETAQDAGELDQCARCSSADSK